MIRSVPQLVSVAAICLGILLFAVTLLYYVDLEETLDNAARLGVALPIILLPGAAWQSALRACEECDVLLVVGTSAVVHPAAGLIGVAKDAGDSVIVVNTQSSAASGMADVELLGPAGEVVDAIIS